MSKNKNIDKEKKITSFYLKKNKKNKYGGGKWNVDTVLRGE